jgi:hypothetical protein
MSDIDSAIGTAITAGVGIAVLDRLTPRRYRYKTRKKKKR